MKKIFACLALLLSSTACFPTGAPDRSDLWVGTMKVKTGEFPEGEGNINCRLITENNNVGGKCDFSVTVFGRTNITKYLLKGTLSSSETKFQLAAESQPDQPVEIIGTYSNNQFNGKGSFTIPFGTGTLTTIYTLALRREIPIAPVRDTSYNATGRWNISMNLTDSSNGRLSISGSCFISDDSGDLRANCDLSDGQSRFSPTFTGKRSGTRALLSYTSLLQDIRISFSGNFTDSRSFSGSGSLRDLVSSYSGSVSMDR